MSSHDDICDDDEGGEGGSRENPRSRWNRCVFGSVFSISAGILLGTVGTVVMASEVPMLVGTGVGVSMAAAYCGKTYHGGGKSGANSVEDDNNSEEVNQEEDEDVCQCFADDEDDEPAEEEKNPDEQPCSLQQDVDGYQCSCTCIPSPPPPPPPPPNPPADEHSTC